MDNQDTEESQLKIQDKRRFNPDGSLKDDPQETASVPQSSKKVPPPQTPQGEEIPFSTFILSLASSVQMSLGLIPHPSTQKPERNLVNAKQTIDILGMLETKTRGNLSTEEDRLMKQILFELRMRYVEISKSKQ